MPASDDFPEFTNPPLNEVALGVQFAPGVGYQEVLAGEVRALFRKEFPSVEEMPSLPPTFETFGLPQGGGPQISIMAMPRHSRYWFVSQDQGELVQFQQDRLLHNWRKVGDGTNEYPHFKKMIESFEKELQALQAYFASLSPQLLQINQSEISYINHIPLNGSSDVTSAQDWLNFLSLDKLRPDDFTMTFRRVISDAEKKPFGRLMFEAAIGLTESNEKIIQLSIVFRGKPERTDISSAIEFLKYGRELIVYAFKDITTDVAHEKWGMVQ